MKTIAVRNVGCALPEGVRLLLDHGVEETSRAGPVLVAPWPVTTTYERPWERVLLSPVRDANPFFHLAESLWMLAGRRDAAFLNNFVRDFGERFAEGGGAIHGAYGARWRRDLGLDQLDHVAAVLRRDPSSRQAVIQMWDAGESHDLDGAWRDRPCNTHIYLRVREGRLEMTVCCRSNDIIWGAYGANAVHLSVLQEYLAALVGVPMGTYCQVSNNFHAYLSELDRLRQRAGLGTLGGLPAALAHTQDVRRPHVPLVRSPAHFDGELRVMLSAWEDGGTNFETVQVANPWLTTVAWPVLMAHRGWRGRDAQETDLWLSNIQDENWRAACTDWVGRRRAAYSARSAA
jgi:hypothetical protein